MGVEAHDGTGPRTAPRGAGGEQSGGLVGLDDVRYPRRAHELDQGGAGEQLEARLHREGVLEQAVISQFVQRRDRALVLVGVHQHTEAEAQGEYQEAERDQSGPDRRPLRGAEVAGRVLHRALVDEQGLHEAQDGGAQRDPDGHGALDVRQDVLVDGLGDQHDEEGYDVEEDDVELDAAVGPDLARLRDGLALEVVGPGARNLCSAERHGRGSSGGVEEALRDHEDDHEHRPVQVVDGVEGGLHISAALLFPFVPLLLVEDVSEEQEAQHEQ
eukprot:scaffold4118_cov257-Pinguiococcus_pyrenoidosus.AAC.1